MKTKRRYSDDELVTRCNQVELRADENGETGHIQGYAILFNQETVIHDWWGDYREVISPTALANADLSDVRLFINHDNRNFTLARSKNGNGTMTFRIDETGLWIDATLDLRDNYVSKTLYSAVSRGDMDGFSFAFRIRSHEWTDVSNEEARQGKLPLNTITDISIVHEVSVVNFPAYKQTEAMARSEESQSEETDSIYRSYVEARRALEETKDKSELELLKAKARALLI